MVLTHRFGGVKPSFLHGFWGPRVVGGFSPTHLKNMRKSIWIMSPGRDEHLNISNQHLAKVVNQHTELEHTPQNQSFTFPGVSRPGFRIHGRGLPGFSVVICLEDGESGPLHLELLVRWWL